MDMTFILGALIGLLAGAAGGYVLFTRLLARKASDLIAEAERKGEVLKEKKILQAKEKFIELKEQNARELKDRSASVTQREEKVKADLDALRRDQDRVTGKEKNLDRELEKLNQRLEATEAKAKELEKNRLRSVELLEKTANMSAEEAKKELREQVVGEAKSMAATQVQEILEEARVKANQDAKKIVVQTIQRVATEHSVENAVSVFNISNDDVKGRIIGREGRNIRALEAATGVEFIVDDTPEAIILSCFDPVRREIARLSLHQLVTDGRIHPSRIE